MKFHYKLLLITGLLSGSLSADTIILKTGVKYNGKVLSEDETSYLVEVNVTKSIRDERRIPKDHVKEIVKDSPAEKAHKALGKLTPTPDSLSLSDYAVRIKSAQEFLRLHPKSEQSKAVKKALETLEKESKIISAGGIKLDGQLISVSDIEANAYDIHARALASDFAQLASQGQHQQALRKWETLKDDYPASKAYVKFLPLAVRVVRGYQKYLDDHITTLDARIKKRQNVLESLPENDRSRAEAAIAQKQAKYATLIDKEEKELKTRWLTLDPFNKHALDFNRRSTDTELQNLTKVDPSTVKLAGPTYRSAWTALASGNLEEASKLINELKSAYRLTEKYTAPLNAQLEEKKGDQLAAQKKAAEMKAEQERLALEEAKKAAAEAKKASEKKPKGRKKK